jgi:co-chaperonin GroES (HSP10)
MTAVGIPEVDRKPAELEVDTDSSKNVIFVVQGKLGLEAIEDKILVLVDKFRSGYECKECAETGIFISCECERQGHAGQNRLGGICKYCEGKYQERKGRTCTSCQGTGSTIIMPENARAIPTSGVIVSIGPKCTTRSIGERVLFGAHTGYYLPFKGNAKIRVLREDEPMCKILAIGNNEVLGDFLQVEEYQ